jgi:hypothetical protein
MKICPRCEQVLALDRFVRNRSTKSGFGSYCRPCQNAKAAETIKRLHGSTRHYHLKRRYGIGAAEVEQMLDAQRWACLVCDTALTLKTAHIDHDHATGAIPGVLCFNCNGGLGQFRDNAITLRRAASYIERSGRRGMKVAEDGRGGSLVELAWARVVAEADFGTAS